MEFCRQENWSGFPCPTPWDLPYPGMEPGSFGSSALEGGFFTSVPPGKHIKYWLYSLCCTIYPCILFYILIIYILHPLLLYFSSHFPFPIGNNQLILYICKYASFLLGSIVCCVFQIPHVSDIIPYLSFSVWLSSLSKMTSRSIHAAANGRTSSFFMKVKVKSLSHVQLFVTPWTVAYQAPPSMGFSRQEYWSGLPFPTPGDLSNPETEPGSPPL